jgi:hypothetical protein
MESSAGFWIDRVFMGISAVLFIIVSLRPFAVFRLLSYGKFTHSDETSRILRVVRWLAVVAAVCLLGRLFIDIVRHIGNISAVSSSR